MTDPIDDEDDLNGASAERADEGDSGKGEKGKSGKSGSAGKAGDTGEGDSDSFGRGKAGAGAGGGIKISPQKLKEVMADWRHLDVTAVVEAVAEFFADMPMRASANLSVAWEKTKTNVKSFAIVNWVIEFGENTVRELARTRERTRGAARDSRGLQRQKPRTSPGFGMAPGPAGPNGQ